MILPITSQTISRGEVKEIIKDNGVREINEEYRDLVDFSINKLLRTYNHRIKNLIKIEGSTENRIKQVVESITMNSPVYL